jgi:uncharacterized DUF497 family protein
MIVIKGFIWYSEIIDKLDEKHAVTRFEVENLFIRKPIFSKIQKGHVKGENLYRALGQTESGRYMAAFFIYKRTHEALVISARDMTDKERKYYAKRQR